MQLGIARTADDMPTVKKPWTFTSQVSLLPFTVVLGSLQCEGLPVHLGYIGFHSLQNLQIFRHRDHSHFKSASVASGRKRQRMRNLTQIDLRGVAHAGRILPEATEALLKCLWWNAMAEYLQIL